MSSKEGVRSTIGSARSDNEKGMTVLDTLLVCILVGILIGIAIPYSQRLTEKTKEATLRMELVNIRKGVELYHALHGGYPGGLGSLIEGQYVIPMRDDTLFKGEYLHAQAVDPEGNLLDPFGNRYRYDPRGGTVSSSTEGYKTW
ncbi:MAG: type IV pilin protein [Nitrospiria bacterium]